MTHCTIVTSSDRFPGGEAALVPALLASDPEAADSMIEAGVDCGGERSRIEAAMATAGGVAFPSIPADSTYETAATLLTEAGFEPVLVFGDRLGTIRTMTIAGDDALPGRAYPPGTRVEIEAL